MKIAYTVLPHEVEMSASRKEYAELVSLLRSNGTSETELNADGNASPYYAFAKKLMIKMNPDEKVSITLSADGDHVTIAGGLRLLNVLAENLAVFGAESDSDDHLHIEYFDGHYFLDEKTIPMVCCLTP